MRFMVERDTLAEAVAWVARSLPSRPVLPILSGLLLEADSDGLTLSCFDYEVSARIRVEAEVAAAWHGPGPRAPARRDHPESAAAGGRIRLRLEDDVTLTCGPASFTLVTLPVKDTRGCLSCPARQHRRRRRARHGDRPGGFRGQPR